MRFESDRPPGCERARLELPALLYGELRPDERDALEGHLATCPACRDELVQLGEGRALLAHWTVPPLREDPRTIAASIVALSDVRQTGTSRPRRGSLVRLSAMLSGAAAAIILALGLFRTEVDLADGRCSISFRLPGAEVSDAPSAASWPAAWDERAREIVASEFIRQAALLQRTQDEQLADWARQNQAEILRLARATDLARSEDQRAFGAVLDALTREAALEDLRTREALVRLASFVERSPR